MTNERGQHGRMESRIPLRLARGFLLVLLLAAAPGSTAAPAYELHGRVHDVRGRAAPGFTLAIDPPPLALALGDDGSFTATFAEPQSATVTAAHAGYGAPPPIAVDPAPNDAVDITLQPVPQVAANGDFEGAGLGPWQPVGALPVALTQSSVHSGRYAAILGQPAGDTTAAAVRAGLMQRVRLPPPADRPHLSLYARGLTLPLSQLRVTVDDAGERRIMPLKATSGAWTHLWADLTQYGALEVLITVEVWQGVGQPTGQLLVDDVVVGPWRTPGVASVEPAVVPARRSATLVVRGDNFLPGIAARLGDTPLDVVRIDAWTLTIVVPPDATAGLAPGSHPLWLTNPTGEVGLGRVGVGYSVFLPAVPRNSIGRVSD